MSACLARRVPAMNIDTPDLHGPQKIMENFGQNPGVREEDV